MSTKNGSGDHSQDATRKVVEQAEEVVVLMRATSSARETIARVKCRIFMPFFDTSHQKVLILNR